MTFGFLTNARKPFACWSPVHCIAGPTEMARHTSQTTALGNERPLSAASTELISNCRRFSARGLRQKNFSALSRGGPSVLFPQDSVQRNSQCSGWLPGFFHLPFRRNRDRTCSATLLHLLTRDRNSPKPCGRPSRKSPPRCWQRVFHVRTGLISRKPYPNVPPEWSTSLREWAPA